MCNSSCAVLAQLTEAGAVLARHGREILKNIGATLETVRHKGGDARGPVAIGLSQWHWVDSQVPLAETVQVELPLVKVRIREGGERHVLEWLASGRIDFAILYYGFDYTDFDVQPLLEEELFLISAVDNWPPADKRTGLGQSIEFKDLKEIPLVLPSAQQCPLIDQLARSNSIQPDTRSRWIHFDKLLRWCPVRAPTPSCPMLPQLITLQHSNSSWCRSCPQFD